jgi:phosphoribosylformylglycinamidine (FGAM) synthase-like amidotransferase family enzyme
VACGGFSYGDVLGAGGGWAKSVLFNSRARAEFADFFARPETFSLGVCNGCQMLSQLKDLIPHAELWPRFVRNTSESFEARTALVVSKNLRLYSLKIWKVRSCRLRWHMVKVVCCIQRRSLK